MHALAPDTSAGKPFLIALKDVTGILHVLQLHARTEHRRPLPLAHTRYQASKLFLIQVASHGKPAARLLGQQRWHA